MEQRLVPWQRGVGGTASGAMAEGVSGRANAEENENTCVCNVNTAYYFKGKMTIDCLKGAIE